MSGSMRNLYHGMVSDRISQSGEKNQSRNSLEGQLAAKIPEMDWKVQ